MTPQGFLLAAVVALNLLIAGGAWWVVEDGRNNVVDKSRLMAANLVELTGEVFKNEYDKAEIALGEFADDYRLYQALGAAEIDLWVKRTLAMHPAFTSLRLADASGAIVFPPPAAGSPRQNVADRAYFQRLRDDPKAGLQLTGPSRGGPVIVFARRLNEAGGRFSGVATAEIAAEYFHRRFTSLKLDPSDSIFLRDASLRVIAYHPLTPGVGDPGSSAASPNFHAAIARSPDAGFYDSGSGSIDGVDRIIAYRRNPEYGFIVGVGISREVALARWREEARAIVAVVLAVALFSGVLGLYLRRAWRRERAAVDALVERDRLLREVQRLGAIGHFIYDFDRDRVGDAEEFDALVGIDARHPHRLADCLALVHVDDRDEFERRLREAISVGKREFGGSFRIVRADDGSVRHLSGKAVLQRDSGGRPRRIVGLLQDQSEQFKARAELQASEARFRAFFDNAMVGMAITSPAKGWVMVNPALCEFFGMTQAEMFASSWAELTHPDDLDRDLSQFARVLADEIDGYSLEKRFIRPDGQRVHAYIAARAVRRSDRSIDFFSAIVMDIGSRKQAETALRHATELLEAAGSVARVGGWSVELPSMAHTWTAETYRIHEVEAGRAVSLDESLGFHTPEAQAALRGAIDAAIDFGTPWDLELELVTATGKRLWTRSIGRAEVDDGRTIRLYGAFLDINDRKRFESQLLNSRELLRQFLDHLPGMAYVKDMDSRIMLANAGVKAIFGLDPTAMVGRRSDELFRGEFGSKVVADDRRVLEAGSSELIEDEFAGRSYESTKFVIKQNGRNLLGSITLDVTARARNRKRIEALLALSGQSGVLGERDYLKFGLQLAETLTGSRIGFLHFVNEDQETIELVTWTDGALRGCKAIFDQHYPISQAGIWADCFRQKGPVAFNDYPAYAGRKGLPDGHAPLQRLISVPVIEDGKVQMMLGVGNKDSDYDDVDIQSVLLLGTDLWRVVRRMRLETRVHDELEKSRQLNRKLEQAHNQLLQSEKMAAIGQLAAGVAHELNNPIGFVQSNFGSLETYIDDLLEVLDACEDCAAASPDGARLAQYRQLREAKDVEFIKTDIRQLLAESKDGADRVRRIVQNLKEFSHVSEDEWSWADLHRGLDSTLTIVWNEIKYKAEVEKRYGELPPVLCMPSQINQVFMNLLVNAAQAIEAQGRIVIASGRDGDRVWIEVSDNGKGIPAENLDRIFEPFFTTKPVGKGTGLGLSLAYGIVEKHHGHLSVSSQPGAGSTFRIELPINGSTTPPGIE